MKILSVLILLISSMVSFSSWAEMSEEEKAKQRILELYGDKEKYEEQERREREQAEKERLARENPDRLRELNQEEKAQRYRELQEKEKAFEEAKRRSAERALEIEEKENNSNGPQMPAAKIGPDGRPQVDPELVKKITAQFNTAKVEENFFTGMMNDKMKDAALKMMQQNPFGLMSKEELKDMLLVRTQGTPLGNYFKKSPKLVDAMVEVAQDEKAIPSFISLVNKPKKIKTYGFVVVVVMVIAFIMNLKNSNSNILKRIMLKVVIMISASTVNFGAFYFIFKDELQPTVSAIMRVL